MVILNIDDTNERIQDLTVIWQSTLICILVIVWESFEKNHSFYENDCKTSGSQKYGLLSDLFCVINSYVTAFEDPYAIHHYIIIMHSLVSMNL